VPQVRSLDEQDNDNFIGCIGCTILGGHSFSHSLEDDEAGECDTRHKHSA